MPGFRQCSSAAFAVGVAFVMVLGALFVFAEPANADHDAVVWSRLWQTSFTANWDYTPGAYADGKGSLFLVWPTLDASGNWNLSMMRYATRGRNGLPQQAFASPHQVNPTLPNRVTLAAPSVTTDNLGNLYVAWQDSNLNIYVSKSIDAGNTWGAPSRVDPGVVNSWDTQPTIVAIPDGTLFVAWLQQWVPANQINLTIAKSIDHGGTWSSKRNITTLGTAGLLSHVIASDSTGRLYFAYSSLVGSTIGVNFTWSDDGFTWSSPVSMSSGSTSVYPAIAVDTHDHVHVIWIDSRASVNGYNTVWYRRSDDRGVTWTTEQPISQGIYSTAFQTPTLTAARDTIIAGWWANAPGGSQTFGYAVSADAGTSWYPEKLAPVEASSFLTSMTADENGTFYGGLWRFNAGTNTDVGYMIWDGPPSAPTITGIVRGSSSLTVSWSPSPEGDVVGYRLWRSTDGVFYELIASFGTSTATYADTGLSNGTYWYRVASFDVRGTSSHASAGVSATVGKTTAEMVADIEAQIASVQAQLNGAQADITAIQAQLNRLQTDLANLQSTTNTQYGNLQSQLNDLQGRLNAIQAEKATQTESLLNTILIAIVIAVLVMMYLQGRRKQQTGWPPPTRQPPPVPIPPAVPAAAPPQPPKQPGFTDEEL